jgi:UDP-2,3-diacylglucosamine pyrophosphatase LpxH
MSDNPNARHVRTLFISDVHLGTKGAQAELLLDFLRHHEADTIFLVGDIIDGWKLKNGWYFPQSHNDVVQKLLRKARKGARVIYIPGNHDEFFRDFLGLTFGGVEVYNSFIHESADNKKYLIIHGDYFDVVVRHTKWLAFFGDWAYTLALSINTYLNIIRRKLGLTYWSLSAWAKLKVKNAVNFIGRFEEILATEAKRLEVDGVVCGHIHHAAQREINGIIYLNTGDWVESCTAIVENHDGVMEIIHWADRVAQRNNTMLNSKDKQQILIPEAA